MNPFFTLLDRLRRTALLRNRRGSVATWFGLSLVPLLVFTGAGLDLGRTLNQKAQLQNAVDAAALAGASAYTSSATSATAVAAANNYMAQFKASSGLAVTYNVAPSTAVNGTTITLYKIAVTASAPIANTIMAINRASNTISVSASAQNPVYNITINLSSFNASASDLNTISYYIVPADNSAPALADTTLIYSNASSSNPTTATIQMTASQKLGFLLTNTTGGKPTTSCRWVYYSYQCTTTYASGYGYNQYGGSQGSTHYFWSHMSPPSKLAYPTVTADCSLQVLATTGSPTSGACPATTPANGAVSCVESSGQTLHFYWNDMGGPTDDKDFNDAAYTVACAKVDSTVSKGMVLTN